MEKNKRIRVSCILLKDNKILLIHRKKEKEYYVFPGGEVEKGETKEQAALRELMEETTIKAKINKPIYCFYNDNSEQYFYLCDYIDGEPKLSDDCIERIRMSKGNNYYNPIWIDIEKTKEILLFPLEIRDLLIEDYKNNFSNSENVLVIGASEL